MLFKKRACHTGISKLLPALKSRNKNSRQSASRGYLLWCAYIEKFSMGKSEPLS